MISARPRLTLSCTLVLAALLGSAGPVAAQTPGDAADAAFTGALTRERGLRAPGTSPSLADLRDAVADYQGIADRYPDSALVEHALWQASGLALEAVSLYGQDADLERGRRLLRRLGTAHPDGTFRERVPVRLRRLDAWRDRVWLQHVDRATAPDGVVITLHLTGAVAYEAHTLPDPPRLYLDLWNTETAPPLRNGTLRFEGLVSEIRLGRHPDSVTRVVLATAGTTDCETATHDAPFRLTIRCVGPTTVAASPPELPPPPSVPPATVVASTAPADPPATDETPLAVRHLDPLPARESPDPAGGFSVARQLGLGVARLVIDPGHGGRDPGAQAHGLTEADLVLDVALRLEERLFDHYPDLEVVLTRRTDEYLGLEERTALANDVGADLFLSIHANASERDTLRGVETYLLDFATDAEAEALAARENVAARATMAQMDRMLEAIAANSKQDESRAMAEAVQTSLVRSLRTEAPDLPDLGVKQAPFVVLIGARMPSVLTEISFLTNEQDAERLGTEPYRDRVADALLEGLVRYWRSLDPAPPPSLAEAGAL